MLLTERILLALSRKPGSPDYRGATADYTLDNALDFAIDTVPGFLNLIQNQTVLDFGCGPGWQAVALARAGAKRVVGVDINESWLDQARALATRTSSGPQVRFIHASEASEIGAFDVTISLNSFEHFKDPEDALARMHAVTRSGGRIVIAFAEPWLSPHGSHMSFFTQIPWVNLFFTEKTVMRVRAHFRSDGAQRYEDVESGLNKMTIARFERIIHESTLVVESMNCFSVKRLPLVSRIPVVREFFTRAASCVLRVP